MKNYQDNTCLHVRGGNPPYRNVSIGGLLVGGKQGTRSLLFSNTDSVFTFYMPAYVGKELAVKVWLEDQDSGHSGGNPKAVVSYIPPKITTVTPSVNANQGGGGQLIIFGDFLGKHSQHYKPYIFIGPKNSSELIADNKKTMQVNGQSVTITEYSGECSSVLVRIDNVMLQCLYPAGIGFEMDVIATVGGQSSAPNLGAQLSYVDLSGARTVRFASCYSMYTPNAS